jgi:hypothetical protein
MRINKTKSELFYSLEGKIWAYILLKIWFNILEKGEGGIVGWLLDVQYNTFFGFRIKWRNERTKQQFTYNHFITKMFRKSKIQKETFFVLGGIQKYRKWTYRIQIYRWQFDRIACFIECRALKDWMINLIKSSKT